MGMLEGPYGRFWYVNKMVLSSGGPLVQLIIPHVVLPDEEVKGRYECSRLNLARYHDVHWQSREDGYSHRRR